MAALLQYHWLTGTLLSVAFFVSGMLCLVKARVNNDRLPQNDPVRMTSGVGGVANLAFGFVAAAMAALLLGSSAAAYSYEKTDGSLLHRDFVKLLSSSVSVWSWVVAFAVLFFVGNQLFFDSLVKAPNAGYARAVMSVEVVLMTFLSAWLFGAHLTWQTALGVAFTAIGVALVSASSS